MRLVEVLKNWLKWLDSYDGRSHRRKTGGEENEYDVIAALPNPPGSALVTIGDLRELVKKMGEHSNS